MRDVEFIIGVVELTNSGDSTVSTTGVTLIGEGDWTVVEAAVMPMTYQSADGRTQRTIGASNYPPSSSYSIRKWHEAREPIDGRVIEPGETVNVAYRAKAQPQASIDHAEWNYQDESGNEHAVADRMGVDVAKPGTGCDPG